MATPKKQKQDQAPRNIGAVVENVTIQNISAANEHTRDAVVALAKAAEANANAISEIARSLKGSPATMDYGIYLSDVKGTAND